MSVGADTPLLDRFEPTCQQIVRRYFAPGLERDDLLQEARMGVLLACRAFEGHKGAKLSTFVKLVVERHVLTAVKTAQRRKHEPVSFAVTSAVSDDGDRVDALDLVADAAPDAFEQLELRDELNEIAARALMLSDLERASLGGMLDGTTYEVTAARLGVTHKAVDNAMQRARRKLAA